VLRLRSGKNLKLVLNSAEILHVSNLLGHSSILALDFCETADVILEVLSGHADNILVLGVCEVAVNQNVRLLGNRNSS